MIVLASCILLNFFFEFSTKNFPVALISKVFFLMVFHIWNIRKNVTESLLFPIRVFSSHSFVSPFITAPSLRLLHCHTHGPRKCFHEQRSLILECQPPWPFLLKDGHFQQSLHPDQSLQILYKHRVDKIIINIV